jgi:hypothetical protein
MVLNNSKKDQRFAPPYQHKKSLKNMANGFLGTFMNTVDDTVDHMTNEAIKLGTGSAKTLYGDGQRDQIRFDRQKMSLRKSS